MLFRRFVHRRVCVQTERKRERKSENKNKQVWPNNSGGVQEALSAGYRTLSQALSLSEATEECGETHTALVGNCEWGEKTK